MFLNILVFLQASILIGSIAVAGLAYGAKTGVQAYSAYRARKLERVNVTQVRICLIASCIYRPVFTLLIVQQGMPRAQSDLLNRYAANGFQPKMYADIFYSRLLRR